MIAERLQVYSQDWMLSFLSPDVLLVTVVLPFLIGSIPWGYIITRAHGQDIRELGSGNIGMTNVWRVLGWKAGLLVFLLDLAKGIIPVLIAMHYLSAAYVRGEDRFPASWPYAPLIAGVFAVLGHTFTPWLKFKGGKGVATGLGVGVALYGVWILIPLTVFGATLLVTRLVSAGSLLAALALVTISFWQPDYVWPFGIIAAVLVFYTHRSNIRRIIAGTENRVSFGR